MSVEDNKAVVRRFLEDVFSGGDVALVDELFAPDRAYYLNSEVVLEGAEGVKGAIRGVRAMFPDLHQTVEEMIGEGDRVAARFTYSGTYQGGSDTFPASALGKPFSARGLFVGHLADGKIVAAWHSTDRLTHFRQLDLTMAPGPA